MSAFKTRLRRLASVRPETRTRIAPVLWRHANCGCGDDVLAEETGITAGDLDEMFAGRGFDLNEGCPTKDCGKNKGEYGKDLSDEGGKRNWDPENRGKGKCYYQTGDEADRCYVTTNGGPNGQKKPSTGPAKNKSEYNKKYIKQRWPEKKARLAELRRQRSKKASGGPWGRRLSVAKAAFLDEMISEINWIIQDTGGSVRVSRSGVTLHAKGEAHGEKFEARWQWAPRGGIGDLQFEVSLGRDSKKGVLQILSSDPGSVVSESLFAHHKGVLP